MKTRTVTTRLRPIALAAAFFSCLLGQALAQDREVSGRVTNSVDGSLLGGVSVSVEGSSSATQTGADGLYTINAPAGGTLVFSYIGFGTLREPVDNRSVINVALEPGDAAIDEVVVTGYSVQRVKDLTGAVAVVSVKELKQQPSASPIEAVQGKATGVQIINDGAPGATPQIRVRGFSTINNNDPLYVIDGIPYEGKLSWLNANDIESMQVLKDASSASIYGARANNGVVIITTRQGVPGPPRVSLDSYYGTQAPNRGRFPKFLTPMQYAEYVYARNSNAGKTPGTEATTGTLYGTDPNRPVLPEYLVAGSATGHNVTAADADMAKYNYVMNSTDFYQITKANQAGTNWFDVITRDAPMHSHQLSILGGGDGATYAVSGGMFKQDGTYRYTNFERYNVRSNTRFKFLDDRITIGENMLYSYTKGTGFGVNTNTSGDYQGEASPIGWAYRIQTIVPVYDEAGNFGGTRGGGAQLGNADNPLSVLYRTKDNNTNSGQFFGNVFGDAKLLEGLNFRTTFGMRYENWNSRSIAYPNPERAEPAFTNTLNETQGYSSDWTWSNTLTYRQTFNKQHNLTLLVGTEASEIKAHLLGGMGRGFFLSGDMDYYYIDVAETNSANSVGEESSLFSYFGRADYSFSDRYLLSATVRRDGSSNFGPENRFGTFPAGSVAWRLSEEAFAKPITWLSDAKIRVGYGVTGNQRIPGFQYTRRYASNVNNAYYPVGGGNLSAPGLWTSNYENRSVKWEEQKTVNLGLDFSLFNGMIEGAVDVFEKKTDGMLYPVPQPAASVGGGASPFVNSGNVNNKGLEIGLNYHFEPSAGDDEAFRFDVGAFFSSYKNEIVQLAPTVSEQPYLTLRGVTTSILKAGAPLGAFYGYQVAGIYQDAADVAGSPGYTGARVGGFKFADLNGDGKIDAADRTIIGNPHPDFNYSLSLSASYKRFDLSMFFNGSQGNDLFDLTRQYTDLYAFPGAVSTRVLDAWDPVTNPNSLTPTPNADASTMERESSSYYVQDGSFFRMRNLQLGYTLPVARLFNGKISNFRVYASATNLFTITNYTGMDPEVSQYSSTYTAPGVDMGVYPVPRQYLLGLNVTF